MASLSACVECLFAEYGSDYAWRIRAAHAAGFDGVEFWDWRAKDIDGIESALGETGTTLVGMSAGLHRFDGAGRSEFLERMDEGAAAGARLGCRNLIVTGGPRIDGISQEEHVASIVEALVAAAEVVGRHGVVIVLEPLNPVDAKTFWLTDTGTGAKVVEAVASPQVRLLFDVRHSAAAGESPSAAIREYGHLFGHVHVADWPGNHRPGTGAIDWRATGSALREIGYAGWLGFEYLPTAETAASLAAALSVESDSRSGGAVA